MSGLSFIKTFLTFLWCLLWPYFTPLRWRHDELDGVSNHQPHDYLLNRLFGRRSKKTSKLRVTGLCAGNSLRTGEFPAQMASNVENVSIWWRHHAWALSDARPTVLLAVSICPSYQLKTKFDTNVGLNMLLDTNPGFDHNLVFFWFWSLYGLGNCGVCHPQMLIFL